MNITTMDMLLQTLYHLLDSNEVDYSRKVNVAIYWHNKRIKLSEPPKPVRNVPF